MSCCEPSTPVDAAQIRPQAGIPSLDEMLEISRELGGGMMQSDVVVDDVHCGGCIRTIEKGLSALDKIDSVRLNLSTGWLSVKWKRENIDPKLLFSTLKQLGYSAHLAQDQPSDKDPVLRELMIALGVAGFAAANIMLLSVSVWSGAEDATRDLFHWISALLAIPAVGIAGRPFFRPAFKALKAGRLNMDVPISLAVVLALLMSIYETANHGENAYFDASVTLLFFLLIGRTLDHIMRARARGAVKTLLQMMPRGAIVTGKDGAKDYVRLEAIEPGMKITVPLGERIPVDGRIISGTSDFDCSIVNGESAPLTVSVGGHLRAGVMNLSGPVEIEAIATSSNSFIAEIQTMMEAAETGKQKYRRIADRAAAIYAPAVHLLALFTFIGWMVMGFGWHEAAYAAVAVLIITCPCALGLAVPIVQVVAAGKLFSDGIMVKDGVALEKLADVDYAVFDKTGTLTSGMPQLNGEREYDAKIMQIAVSMASFSHHPYSRALVEQGHDNGIDLVKLDDVNEVPGSGIIAKFGGDEYRLGRSDWALSNADKAKAGVVLSRAGKLLELFEFQDQLRPAAASSINALKTMGIEAEILSGDQEANVAKIASELGDVVYSFGVTPAQKAERLQSLASQGHKTLMVGDGINDAPALASAHVSIAPASAADVGRNASDMIFLRDSLDAVPRAVGVSRMAKTLIQQNFGLAIAYNMIAVPLAVFGYATPLIAALAMSSSSILVTLNALRLKFANPGGGAREIAPRTLKSRKSSGRAPQQSTLKPEQGA